MNAPLHRSIPTLALLALLAITLAPSVARAFEHKRTPDGSPVRWQEETISVVAIGGDDPELAAALGMAADAWRGYPGVPDLDVTRFGRDGGPPDVRAVCTVERLQRWPFEPGRLAVASTTYTPDGAIVRAAVYLNGEMPLRLLPEGRPMSPGEAATFDMASVLAHELGHVLGLEHSHADPLGTMWPRTGRGEVHQRTLAPDDEAGVIALYEGGAAPAPVAGCAVTGGPRASRPGSGPGGIVALVVALALGGVQARRRWSP